jgi:hypothetical protein
MLRGWPSLRASLLTPNCHKAVVAQQSGWVVVFPAGSHGNFCVKKKAKIRLIFFFLLLKVLN